MNDNDYAGFNLPLEPVPEGINGYLLAFIALGVTIALAVVMMS